MCQQIFGIVVRPPASRPTECCPQGEVMKRVMFLVLAALIHTSALGQGLETLKPGIVRIITKPEGMRQTGTGFIVKLEPGIAYILTAYHVVAGDNAPQVEFFSRRNQPVKAEIIKLQPDKRDGLGLIAVRGKDNLPPDLIPLPIAMDSKISGGDALHTIGFGAGQGDWAVLPASILAIDGSDLKLDGRFKPGNSGGPVLKDGKVVGILTDEQEGVGLASLASIMRIVLRGWGVDPPAPVGDNEATTVTHIGPVLPPIPCKKESNEVSVSTIINGVVTWSKKCLD